MDLGNIKIVEEKTIYECENCDGPLSLAEELRTPDNFEYGTPFPIYFCRSCQAKYLVGDETVEGKVTLYPSAQLYEGEEYMYI